MQAGCEPIGRERFSDSSSMIDYDLILKICRKSGISTQRRRTEFDQEGS